MRMTALITTVYHFSGRTVMQIRRDVARLWFVSDMIIGAW